MKHHKLRQHYLKAQKYTTMNPNDAGARESLNQFLLSLQVTNREIYDQVTSQILTDDEQSYVNTLFAIKKPKREKREKWKDDDLDDEMEWEFEERDRR